MFIPSLYSEGGPDMGHTKHELWHTELVCLSVYVEVAFLLHLHQASFDRVVYPAVYLRPEPLHSMVLEKKLL